MQARAQKKRTQKAHTARHPQTPLRLQHPAAFNTPAFNTPSLQYPPPSIPSSHLPSSNLPSSNPPPLTPLSPQDTGKRTAWACVGELSAALQDALEGGGPSGPLGRLPLDQALCASGVPWPSLERVRADTPLPLPPLVPELFRRWRRGNAQGGEGEPSCHPTRFTPDCPPIIPNSCAK